MKHQTQPCKGIEFGVLICPYMRHLFLLITCLVSLGVFSQGDSIVLVDTTVLGGDEEVLVFSNNSWSQIPQEDTVPQEALVLRKDSGMLLLTAKIGFSDSYDDTNWKGYSVSNFPPLAFQVEYFHNDLWSYGGQLLYSRNKFTNDTLETTYFKDNTVGLAAIGSFHYGTWLQDITHNWFKFGYLDLYASLAVRMDIHRYVEAGVMNEETLQYESDVVNKDMEVKMRVRPIFGARYYISDRFSINMEVGRGNLGMLTSSVSWLINKPEGLILK